MEPETHTILLSIGCNHDCKVQMQRVRECLKRTFPDARFTDDLVSPAYNMPQEATKYTNSIAHFTTTLTEEQLAKTLKHLEAQLGDTKELRMQDIVMMDLDILQFNKEKRHIADWSRPYIKTLMKRLTQLSIALALTVLTTLHSPFSALYAQSDGAKTLLSKAIEYYTGQKYHECILSFTELEKHYKLNPRYTAYLGYSYYKEAQYDDAVKCLEKGIPQLKAYSPFEQASYIYACAESYFNLQKFQESIPWYEKALPLVNGIDKGDIFYHTGFAHYMSGNNTEAYNNLLKADSIYNDSIYGASLDKQHIARRAQVHNMLRALH